MFIIQKIEYKVIYKNLFLGIRQYDCEQTAQEDVVDNGTKEDYNHKEEKAKKSFDQFKF